MATFAGTVHPALIPIIVHAYLLLTISSMHALSSPPGINYLTHCTQPSRYNYIGAYSQETDAQLTPRNKPRGAARLDSSISPLHSSQPRLSPKPTELTDAHSTQHRAPARSLAGRSESCCGVVDLVFFLDVPGARAGLTGWFPSGRGPL
jgi:hypothetical protein